MSGFGAVADVYVLRARIYPAMLTVLPLALLALLIVPTGLLPKIVAFAVSAGLVYFLSQWVRDRGVRLQDRLLRRWGGWPTTAMLRCGKPDDVVRQRRRQRLQEVTGLTLPVGGDDGGPSADAAYQAATRALITKIRAKPGAERVQDENTAYGFRRNLLALKPVALAVTAVALSVDVFWLASVSIPTALICSVAHLLIVLAWFAVVTPDFVHRQAEVYAERLFETLEDARFTATEAQR